MILAAGRGERMKPLTDTLPKPLLKVGDKELIVWHLEKLKRCGFKKIIINIAYLSELIKRSLGDGSRWGLEIIYSDESKSGALESAGGIKNALHILGGDTFLVLNADIFCDYDFNNKFNLKDKMAHLILVPNPKHNPHGDFGLKNNLLLNDDSVKYTFSGIGYYSHKLFDNIRGKKVPLAPLLRDAIKDRAISGELFTKMWHDIGTQQRLLDINKEIK